MNFLYGRFMHLTSSSPRSRFGIRFSLLARRWRRALDAHLVAAGLTDATWVPLVHLEETGGGLTQTSQDLAADGTVSGPEAALVQRFADAHGYALTWVPGSHDALMRDLARAHLHAVAGGHHPDSPWKPDVAWSQPLSLRALPDGPMPERRIALPPGQSAWHLAFDRHLAEREGAQ